MSLEGVVVPTSNVVSIYQEPIGYDYPEEEAREDDLDARVRKVQVS